MEYKKPLPNVLFLCGGSPGYPSNRIKMSILGRHTKLRCLFSNRKNHITRLLEVMIRFPFYMWNVDVFFVGWIGHPLVILIRLFSKKPIIFDLQTELFEAICIDRKYYPATSFIGRLAWFLDSYAHRKSDIIIVHDRINAERIQELFNIPSEKLVLIPMCADRSIFYPRPQVKPDQYKDKFLVEFCGEMSPSHGIEYIIRAAKLLEGTDIFFRISGKGQCLPQARALYEELHPTNVEFVGRYLTMDEFIEQKASADLSLAMFGDTPKSHHILMNKHFETIAMARPFVTGGPPKEYAVAEFFTDGEDAFFVPLADSEALAKKIQWIRDHESVRKKVAENGRALFAKICSQENMDKRVLGAVEKVYGSW